MLPPIVFSSVYALWLLSEILLNRLLRATKTDQQKSDKNTLISIWVVVACAMTIGTYIAKSYNLPVASSPIINTIGLLLIVAAVVMRLLVVRALGVFFTVNVTIKKDHKLIKTGFYTYIRHPSYTALLAAFLGYGISLNNWCAILIIFVPIFISIAHRINIEEAVLINEFGDEYTHYKSHTKKLLPFIY